MYFYYLNSSNYKLSTISTIAAMGANQSQVNSQIYQFQSTKNFNHIIRYRKRIIGGKFLVFSCYHDKHTQQIINIQAALIEKNGEEVTAKNNLLEKNTVKQFIVFEVNQQNSLQYIQDILYSPETCFQIQKNTIKVNKGTKKFSIKLQQSIVSSESLLQYKMYLELYKLNNQKRVSQSIEEQVGKLWINQKQKIIQDQRKQVNEKINHVEDYCKVNIANLERRLREQQTLIKNLKEEIKKNGKVVLFGPLTKYLYPLPTIPSHPTYFTPPQSIVDFDSAFIHKFKINGSTVEFKDQFDGKWYQLLGSIPITNKKQNSFTIENTLCGNLVVGIITKQYIIDRRSDGKDKCIYYFVVSHKK